MTPTPDDAERERQDDAAYDMAGYVMAMLALLVLGGVGLAWTGKAAKARETNALEAIPDVLATWPMTDDITGQLGVVALLAPAILLALGLSNRWTLTYGWSGTLSSRTRWILAAVAAILVATGTAANALNDGRDLGVATLSGAVWLHDGAPRDEVRWEQAERVEITCWDGALTYDVTFPGDRLVPLAAEAATDIGGWINHATLVDQTLRAYAVPRFRDGEEACLRGYDEGLIPSERARFRAVVAG